MRAGKENWVSISISGKCNSLDDFLDATEICGKLLAFWLTALINGQAIYACPSGS
jgi:hypothetical protein